MRDPFSEARVELAEDHAMFYIFGLIFVALLTVGRALALDCGGATSPCEVALGEYHLATPAGWRGGPAVIYLHGFGGSGRKVIGNEGFVRQFTARGFAVIAPTALPWRENKPNDWAVHDGDTYPRDDAAFLREVLSDAIAHASVDRDRVLLTGFSRGGSMVWDVACLTPEFARGYAPIAGGFWLPMPEDCAGPVHMLHTHGFADEVVPLEGRGIHSSESGELFVQGDIWMGLQFWRRENGCPSKPADHGVTDDFWRKRWNCDLGGLVKWTLVLEQGRALA